MPDIAGPDLTQWYIGLAVGFAVIVVAVVLVGSILALAARIARQAESATRALEVARVNTLPLWDLQRVNDHLRAIHDGLRTARTRLLEG